MKNQLIDQLFSCVEDPNAEDLWLNLLKDYQCKYGKVEDVRDSETQWTLLHYAAENLFVRVAEWLIEQGSEIDALDLKGNTPFLIGLDAAIDYAVQENNNEIDFSIITLLLSKGANEDLISNDGTDKDALLKAYGSNAANQYKAKVKGGRP